VPQGSILGPLFFLLYTNDITEESSKGANIFLHADDTSIIVTNPEYNGYRLIMNKIFQEANKRFKSNLLTKLKKKLHIQFTTINQDEIDKYITFGQKQVVNSKCIKFWGLYILIKYPLKTILIISSLN
jgi:hypothetical protein